MRASAWTIATGMGTRVLGVVGTLILMRFIAPFDYGEVQAAIVLVWTANQLSTLNVGTYILAHPKSGRDVMFHATLLHVVPGFLALLIVWIIGWRFGARLNAPHVGQYLPGMVLAVALDRMLYMPERALVRTMSFGAVSVSRAVGEVTFTVVSILTAWLGGWGGMSIVWGNLARSAVRFFVTASFVSWRDWIEVTRVRWGVLREMIRFGVPVAVGGLATFGVRRWDNLVVSAIYGPATLGAYNLAYNLADIPAVQVGEQISDVLQAAFSRAGGDRRRALLRSLGVLAFLMTPMAVGLGCIAPTLGAAFFDARWAAVGGMLAVLAVISFTRPISNTVGAYLQVRRKPRIVAVMDVLTLVGLLGALWTLGRVSPLWACAAVGIVFTLRMLAWGFVLRSIEQIPLREFMGPLLPPVIACLPMIAIIALIQRFAVVNGHLAAIALLGVEVLVGALAYTGAAWLFARRQLREFVSLLRHGLSSAA